MQQKTIAYIPAYVDATSPTSIGTIDLDYIEIDAGGAISSGTLTTIESFDKQAQGEISLSKDGMSMVYYNRKKYIAGFNYQQVEMHHFIVSEDRISTLAHSQLLGTDAGTKGKSSVSIDKDGTMYFNQNGLYQDKLTILGSEVLSEKVTLHGIAQDIELNINKTPIPADVPKGTPLATTKFGDIREGQDDKMYVASSDPSTDEYHTLSLAGDPSTQLTGDGAGVGYTVTITATTKDERSYLPGSIYKILKKEQGQFTRTIGRKQYECKDHLGNVRAVVSDARFSELHTAGTEVTNYPEVLALNDYYPFGMELVDKARSKESYRFEFNGAEKDDEIKGSSGTSLDFGARIYDSRLGRWSSVDPLAGKYPFASPYVFALNTPVQAYDPDGRLVVFVSGYEGVTAAAKDFFDVTGMFRGLYRLFASEDVYENDDADYWGEMDDKFVERIGDDNIIYGRASAHGLGTASDRTSKGKEAGEALLKKISSNDICIEAGETIKIVSHSQGSAYAAGISKVLTDAGYTVEVEYNLAPKQPDDIARTAAGRVAQYGSDQDWIAPQSPMPGAVEHGGGPVKDGKVDGHLLGNYTNIFDIKEGKKGYVAPKKDKPVK